MRHHIPVAWHVPTTCTSAATTPAPLHAAGRHSHGTRSHPPNLHRRPLCTDRTMSNCWHAHEGHMPCPPHCHPPAALHSCKHAHTHTHSHTDTHTLTQTHTYMHFHAPPHTCCMACAHTFHTHCADSCTPARRLACTLCSHTYARNIHGRPLPFINRMSNCWHACHPAPLP